MEPKAWLCEWPGEDGSTYVHVHVNELAALDQKKRRPDTTITPLYSLDGISQDAIDGGWSIKGLSDYAKSLEAERASFVDAFNEIAFIGTDCPHGFERDAFMERQLMACMRTAIRALRSRPMKSPVTSRQSAATEEIHHPAPGQD